MTNNIPVIQLSNVKNVEVMFTAWDSPIWRARLWVDPNATRLPFMASPNVNYNKYAVSLNNIMIDFVEYLKVSDYKVLRDTPKTFMIDTDPSILYIHFENHNPSFGFLSFKSGILIGFSYGKSITLGELKTYPLLLDFPEIEDSSDNFTYQKMKFSSGTIKIDNSKGMLDDLIELFGNDMTLSSWTPKQTLEIVRQYFIDKYSIGLKTVSFSVKDKRSRLTFKAPNTYYSKDEYPYIDDNNLDKVIQDAYGYCRGVTGTCINRKQVYNPPTYQPASGFNDWFEFKFARTITKVEEVWVNKSDMWTQVFPGLGIPGNTDSSSGNAYQSVNPNPIKIVVKNKFGVERLVDIDASNMNNIPNNDDGTPNDGRIAIWWSQALKDNPGHLERRNGSAEKVKMTGVFVDLHTPGEIVSDMMTHYGSLPYKASYFDLDDWETEMMWTNSYPIGICLNKADNIYSWIEKIQNGSGLGFQMIIYKNLFSARVDNPNRRETFNIKWQEIQNLNEIEPELNGDRYATYTKINYLQDYTDEEWLTEIDQSKRTKILDVYKYEKEYVNDCFLVEHDDVVMKGNILLETFSEVRPIIPGIVLNGLRWNEIKLFSTGWIDFSADIPRNMKAVQVYMKKRNFVGRLRVKVLSCKRDLINETTTIDVIQSDKVASLVLDDITGEKAFPAKYEGDYDNTNAGAVRADFEYEIVGGDAYGY